MANAREVKQRIKSVQNISQVTKALEAVSASKVRKAIDQLEDTRPYSIKAWQVLQHIASMSARSDLHPLLEDREEVKKVIAIVISGDRGLAGAYNTNIIKEVMTWEKTIEQPVRYLTVGKKGRDLLVRRGKDILAEFSDLPASPSYADISPIGRIVVDDFCEHVADEIYFIYTRFINRMRHEPVVKRLLPLAPEDEQPDLEGGEVGLVSDGYIFEPDPHLILDFLVPRFTSLQVYHAVIESLASEHSARMVAMKNATDNAISLADALQLEYNKARQQAITNEMLDIVGGAQAVT